MERPLDSIVLSAIKGVVDPETRIILEGEDRGTFTEYQYPLVIENNVRSLEPKQSSLFEEGDFLSNEAVETVTDHTVRLVRGVAGSGKTLVLIHRARYLIDRYPNARIMVLTYNVDVAEKNLRRHLPEGVEVLTFHKLCSKIMDKGWKSPNDVKGWLNRFCKERIENAGLSVEFVADEIAWRKDLEVFNSEEYLQLERKGRGKALTAAKRQVINNIFGSYIHHQLEERRNGRNWWDWDDIPAATLETLKNNHPLKDAYDIILIDEAQDFAPTWIKVIKPLLKSNGSLFLCDDPTQSLFRYFSWRQKGVEVVGRTRVLRVPFRCTREINAAAYSLIQADPILSKDEETTLPDLESAELLDGSLPLLVRCEQFEQEIAFVKQRIDKLLASGIRGDQIAVLCHDYNAVKRWEFLKQQHNVYVSHFDKMKGLEFNVVFVPGLQKVALNDLDEVEISKIRRKVFTAMTRARHTLVLLYQFKLPGILSPILSHVENISASS